MSLYQACLKMKGHNFVPSASRAQSENGFEVSCFWHFHRRAQSDRGVCAVVGLNTAKLIPRPMKVVPFIPFQFSIETHAGYVDESIMDSLEIGACNGC